MATIIDPQSGTIKDGKNASKPEPEFLRRVARKTGISEAYVAYIASFYLTLLICAILVPTGILVGMAFDATGVRVSQQNSGELLLQSAWNYLTKGWLADYTNHAVFPGALSILWYFLSVLPCAILDILSPKWASSFKIQQDKRAKAGSWRLTIGETLKHHILYIFPNVVFQYMVKGPWLYRDNRNKFCLYKCDGRDDLFPELAPTLTVLLVETITCLILFDAFFHYWHRIHHLSRLLYKHVHSIHHQFNSPFVWVTQYAHTLELFTVSILSILPPFAIGAHPMSEWAFLMVAVSASVDAHTGYDFSLLDKVSSLWGGSIHHDKHHQNPRTNFQPFFTWFDEFHGTTFIGPEGKDKSL